MSTMPPGAPGEKLVNSPDYRPAPTPRSRSSPVFTFAINFRIGFK